MSLLTPVKVPVKVYRWDDVGAPALDKTAGCMMTIFKACLITGYGTKQGAGWTMPFEDATTKVFRPEVSVETDFYLQCSADSGSQVKTGLYKSMTNAVDGELMIETETPFVYGFSGPAKWVMIASSRGVWFFVQADGRSGTNKHAVYFTAGDTGLNSAGEKGIYCRHTGGTWGLSDKDRRSIFEQTNIPYGGVNGKFYKADVGVSTALPLISFFDGMSNKTPSPIAAQVYLATQGDYYELPLFGCSNTNLNVFDLVDGARSFIVVSTSLWNANICMIPTDYWEV